MKHQNHTLSGHTGSSPSPSAGYGSTAATVRSCMVAQYCRVALLDRDPLQMAVQPCNFERQMEYLAENYRVLSPEYLEYCLVRGRPFPNRSVALMFDGGYAELLYTVDEVLAQFDLSAIAFVPSSHLLEKRSRWYDELEELLIAGSSGDLADLVIDGNPVELCLRTQYDRLEAYGYLLQRLATMSPPQQREVLDQLIRAIGQTGGQFDDHRMLDAEELQRLESSGRIRIAGTTHHHVDRIACRWRCSGRRSSRIRPFSKRYSITRFGGSPVRSGASRTMPRHRSIAWGRWALQLSFPAVPVLWWPGQRRDAVHCPRRRLVTGTCCDFTRWFHDPTNTAESERGIQ